MLRALTFACVVAICRHAAGQAMTADDLLAKLCPETKSHRLAGDDLAILQTVAAHFRQFEWSPRRDGTYAHVTVARHAVPALKSPQVLLRNTIRYWPHFDSALRVELERHAVTEPVAVALSKGLRLRNADGVALDASGSGLVALSCRELFSMAYTGASPPSGDFKNASRAISISLPAYDEKRTTALLLAVSSLEYALEGKMEDLELILLRAEKPGAWRIEWHADIADSVRPDSSPAAAATTDDYAVFDGVLAYLGQGCIAVVNQTRTGPLPTARDMAPQDLVAGGASAIDDLGSRSTSSAYIGKYAPRRGAALVHREVLEAPATGQKPECSRVIHFSLPGYGAGSAAVVYTLRREAPDGIETGEGWALLKRTADGWRVDKHAFERWMLVPR